MPERPKDERVVTSTPLPLLSVVIVPRITGIRTPGGPYIMTTRYVLPVGKTPVTSTSTVSPPQTRASPLTNVSVAAGIAIRSDSKTGPPLAYVVVPNGANTTSKVTASASVSAIATSFFITYHLLPSKINLSFIDLEQICKYDYLLLL